MDEEQQSEASGEGAEWVGPYLLQEQVQQSNDSQEVGSSPPPHQGPHPA